MSAGIPLRLEDYLALVDWTGRTLREDKRGAISDRLPPILERLQIDPRNWLYLSRNFESRFRSLVGSDQSIRTACEQLGKHWAQGVRECERFFSPSPTS
ncbi:hypothetical protein [Microbulbifer sp.]|uniref:hypothetical protein n=1 Tax=Microbulbifer sp. TaxID=1908541 RepID=UPI003F410379